MKFFVLAAIALLPFTAYSDGQTLCTDGAVVPQASSFYLCNSRPENCSCKGKEIQTVAERFRLTLKSGSAGKLYSCQAAEPIVNCLMTAQALQSHAPDATRSCDDHDRAPDSTEPSGSIGNWLVDQLSQFPEGCGYNIRVKVSVLTEAQRKVIDGDQREACAPSMCTSASYMAFLVAVKKLFDSGRLPGGDETYLELLNFKGRAWSYFNDLARPDEMMKELGLGDGRVIAPGQISECAQRGWPRRGDFVQIWRKNGSGHSVVFEGLLYDAAGQVSGLCYWSSNQVTQGYAKRCESIDSVSKMIVGRLTL